MRPATVVVLVAALSLSAAPAALAAPPTSYSVTVTSDFAVNGACDDGQAGLSLREAICFAVGDDASVVNVPAGTFTLSAGPLRVNPTKDVDLTLAGAGAGATVIDAHGASRVLDLDETLRGGVDVTVSGMTLTGGAPRVSDATYGGGAIVAGSGTPGAEDSLTLTDCAVTNSRNLPTGVTSGTADAMGAGVQMTGGALTIQRCTFSGNTSVDAAGGAVAFVGVGGTDRVTVDASTFRQNSVTGSAAAGVVGGAGLFVYGGAPVTSVTGTLFVQNTATTLSASPAEGGALRVDAGTATVAASAFDGNTTTNGGTATPDAVRGAVPTGSWFGCATADASCDRVGGATPVSPVGLTLTATPTIDLTGRTVALDAAFRTSGGGVPDADLLAALRLLGPAVWSAADGTATGATTIDATGHLSGSFTIGTTNGQPTVTVAGSSAQAAVTRAVPASIVASPTSTAVAEGDVATFTASASGVPAPDLQWYSAPVGSGTFTELTGKTGGTLTVTADRTLDGTQYMARAYNDFTTWPPGAPTSVATLTVLWGPTVSTTPQATAVVAGSDATFTVAATGNPVPTVAWQTSPDGSAWTAVPGQTGTTYVRTTVAGDEGLRVRAVLTGASTVTTPAAVLTVHSPPSIATVADQVVADGASATFTAVVTGNPPASLVWQRRVAGTWTDVPGATGTTLTVVADPTLDGAQYRVVASSTLVSGPASATSNTAELHVLWGPALNASPQDTTVVSGSDATFTVSATGNPVPTVVWQTSPDGSAWTTVPAQTGTTYTRTTSPADDGLRVRAVLTGAATVTTSAAVLTVQTPPTVVTSADQTVADGAGATFTATVTGSPAPTLVWQRLLSGTWTDLPGETGTTLTVTAAPSLDGAQYRAVASSTLVSGPASATSTPATLHVLWGPSITAQPSATTVVAGADATFTAAATGNPAPTVRWESSADAGGSWAPIPGATSTTYTRTTVAGDDGLLVRAVFTGAGTTTTSAVALTVQDGPAFTDQPDAVTADAGTTATFTVAVTGSPAPTLQWQTLTGGSWTDLVGETGATLSFTAVESGTYRVVATNVVGSVPSTPAALVVLAPPTVTDPSDAATHPGAAVTFSVDVAGSPTPAVGWETSPDGVTWTSVPGASSTTLTLTPSLADDGLQVRAVATAPLVGGPVSVRSAAATLAVVDLPALAPGTTPAAPVSAVAGSAVHLSWVVLSSGGTPAWSVSRDGGSMWGAAPASFQLGSVTGVGFVQGLRTASAPATRTAYTADFTPTLADDGMLVRLVVTNAAGSTTFGPVAVHVTAPAAAAPAASPTRSAAATAAAPRAALSSTGFDVWPTVGLAVLLVALGAAGVTAVRRRRDA